MKPTNNVTVTLGTPVLAPYLIPVAHTSTPNCISAPFMVDSDCYKVTALSLGSPHGAVVVDDVDAVDVQAVGASLGTHRLFPKGASIVFIQMLDRETLKARLWKRAEGETGFSAEAAGAAAAAAMILQKVLHNKANVVMDGDIYEVEWHRGAANVRLTGPAHLLGA